MNMNVDEVRIMSQVRGSPGGIRSVFVKIDDNWAIKLFQYYEDRDRAYKNQEQAAQYDLGPEVGEKIEFSVDCEYPYGYITEIVDVLVPHDEVAEDCYETYDYYAQSEEYHRLVDELRSKLSYFTGIDYGDMHPANIGIKNGSYVLIDFGQEDLF